MQGSGQALLRTIAAVTRWLVVLVAVCLPLRLAAEPRIALVIGNGAYGAVTPLANPENDASLVADTLRSLGFEVTLLTDAGLADMRRGFARFGQALRAAGPDATGLFYYAGHGVQSFGSNYLLPVDAKLTDAADLDLVAVEAQSVLRQMASARNKTNIFILDACRNNPFKAIPDLNDSGLAEMKAPTGTFLAYATAPGAVALDGADGNSPFTEALAQAMTEKGVRLEQMFKQVRVAVLKATGGMQTPWDTSSMTQDFYFAGGALSAGDIAEEQVWDSVAKTRDPVQIMLYMRGYPEGRHFEEARELLAEVMQESLQPKAPPAPVVKAPPPAASEQKDFEAAQAAGSAETWKSFIAAHPTSVFREIAETELAALTKSESHDPTPEPPKADEMGEVSYDQPLTAAGPELTGRKISEVLALSPIYPPIEGLPEPVWKGKHCTDCHEWDRKALCDQGTFFVANDTEIQLGEVHPLGGYFRRVLKRWAEQGCR